MEIKRIAQATGKVMASYLTYQAVLEINNQLVETNPPLAAWFSQFSGATKMQDGEAYLVELLKVNQELAFRVMAVRQNLAQEVLDYLPAMVRTGIEEANMNHQRQYLERITQISLTDMETDLNPEETPD